MKYFLLFAALSAVALAQQNTTPVPILKQINRHNEDGSYSYGYEGADGSYKIETKYPTGEVYGKYGYVDDQGKLREIEYGASKRGFEPAGNEINVPPPTLTNNQAAIKPLGPNEEDDGQYREDPSIYYKDEKYNNNNVQPTNYAFNQISAQPKPTYQQPAYQQTYKPQTYQPQTFQQQTYQQPQTYQPQTYQPQTYQPQTYQPQTYQQPRYNPVQPQPIYYNPAHPNFNPYLGHPAQNLDISTGSYSVSYKK